jgi:hypothetical protein
MQVCNLLIMLTYEKQLIAHADIGSFYMYANRQLRNRSAVGPLYGSYGYLVPDALG